MTRTWGAIKLSPASPPPHEGGAEENTQQLHFTGDRHYFIHGEIIALAAITIFAIFLIFLILPCVSRAATSTSAGDSSGSAGNNKNWLLLQLRKRRCQLQEEISMEQSSDEINRYPYSH